MRELKVGEVSGTFSGSSRSVNWRISELVDSLIEFYLRVFCVLGSACGGNSRRRIRRDI